MIANHARSSAVTGCYISTNDMVSTREFAQRDRVYQ